MPAGVTITGLKECQQMLVEAPRVIVANAYLRALKAAADVMEAALYWETPEREEGQRSEDVIHLKDAIVSAIEIDSRFRGGALAVGFGSEGFRALWVEEGHRMIGHEPEKKDLGKSVSGVGFMLRAFDACADECIDAFCSVLISELREMYG